MTLAHPHVLSASVCKPCAQQCFVQTRNYACASGSASITDWRDINSCMKSRSTAATGGRSY